MNITSSVSTIRKFWNFLEGLYPFLGTFRQRAGLLCRRLAQVLPFRKALNRLEKSPKAAAVKSLVESFLWHDLSKQRLQLQSLPAGALAILRPLYLGCLFLVVLLPATWIWVWPLVPWPASEGVVTPVAGWSVLLWALCMAMGWGALLAGTGAANRTSFTIAAILFQYIFALLTVDKNASGIAALALVFDRWWIGLTTLWATALCQRRLAGKGRWPSLYSLASCFLVGIVAGIFLWRSLPVAASFPGQNLNLGIVLGCGLGAITHFAAQIGKETVFARLLFEPFQSVAGTTYTFMFCHAVSLTIPLVARGLPDFSQSLLLGHQYLMTHLWPLWYFIGVGIIFRILKNSRAVTQSAGILVKPAVFMPIALLFFAAGFITTVSYQIFMSWSDLWPQWVMVPAYHVYTWTKDIIWERPALSFTMEWMFPVFAFDMAAVGWLAVRRRLDAPRLQALLFLNVLSFFLIYEYFFQSFSFMRSPGHSITLYVLFSVWLLWLVQSSTYSLADHSTPLWPSDARMAIFGSGILFALLEIHARTAIHDFQAMTEVFWFMYRGIVDVGVPFGLYVFARRRLEDLPLPVNRVFVAFCAGALATMPLNFLEHLILAGGSWSLMRHDLSLILDQALGHPQAIPVWWALVRAVLVATLLAGTAWVSHRGQGGRPSHAARIFTIISVGLGLAAFSNTRISLLIPFMPSHWEVFWQPVYSSPLIEYSLVFLFFAFGLPALMIGLAPAPGGMLPRAQWILTMVGAILLNSAFGWIWPAHKPFLEASGLVNTLALAGAALSLLLMDRVRFRVETDMALSLQKNLLDSGSNPAPEYGGGTPWRKKLAALMVFLSVLGVVGSLQWQRAQVRTPLIEAGLKWLAAPILVPAAWQALPSADSSGARSALFAGPAGFSTRPLLAVAGEYRPSSGSLMELVRRRERDNVLPGYRRSEIEDWRRYYPGAVALHFSIQPPPDSGSVSALAGLSVFLPTGRNEVVTFTFLDSSRNRDLRVLDMIRMVEAAALAWPGRARFMEAQQEAGHEPLAWAGMALLQGRAIE